MMNTWQQLRQLIKPEQRIALVTVVNADGTSIVSTPTGLDLVLIGDTVAAGDMCLYDGYMRIIGKASTLSAGTVFLPEVDRGFTIYTASDSTDYGSVTDSTVCYQNIDYGAIA